MKISNNFIINPNEYLQPSYLISPFNTNCISQYQQISDSTKFNKYLKKRFKNKEIYYTSSGKQSLSIILDNLKLGKKDCVSIFTTSENFYISSCVTKEIEKICQWSRKIEDNTKVIFINHEFGYKYQNIKKFNKLKLPIIEDYAHSFFLNNKNELNGDYAIFSLPKMFPIQIGGLIISKDELKCNKISDTEQKYINNVISKYIVDEKEIIEKRNKNYKYLCKKFKTINIEPFFKNIPENSPGVFMFKTPTSIDLTEFKIYVNQHGIQSSVFYGQNAYFIPIHQNLTTKDLDYFFEVIKSFLQK